MTSWTQAGQAAQDTAIAAHVGILGGTEGHNISGRYTGCCSPKRLTLQSLSREGVLSSSLPPPLWHLPQDLDSEQASMPLPDLENSTPKVGSVCPGHTQLHPKAADVSVAPNLRHPVVPCFPKCSFFPGQPKEKGLSVSSKPNCEAS